MSGERCYWGGADGIGDMGTRGVIARPTGDGFEGRYHHFDSYPSGLGATLWEIKQRYYPEADQLEDMQAALIDEHPAGWSDISGADWSLEAGFVNSMEYDCTVCGLSSSVGHYRQYLPADDPRRSVPEGGSYLYADHQPERPPMPNRPQCYCHGERSEAATELITSEGDDWGAEWAYVLSPGGLMVCERRWVEDGAHMVGMFGQGGGVDGATWLPLGIYRWEGAEPSWSALEGVPETVS